MFQRRYSLLFIFLNCYSFVKGQEPFFRHYSVNEGLPSSEVYCALQDKKGYMWFGTDRGIARFDGYQFKTFTTEDGLSDNTVFNILEDKSGTLWFRTFTSKISTYKNNVFKSSSVNLPWSNYFSFFVDSLGRIISRDGKGHILAQSEHKPKPEEIYYYGSTLDSMCVAIFDFDSSKSYFDFISGGSVIPISDKSVIFQLVYVGLDRKVNYIPLIREQTDMWVGSRFPYSICKLSGSDYLIAFGRHLFCFNSVSKKFTRKDLSYDTGPLYIDSQENVWMGGSTGVHCFRKEELIKWLGSQENTYKLTELSYLPGKIITGIVEDSENGIWLTCLNDGVFYLSNQKVKTLSIERLNSSDRVLSITPSSAKHSDYRLFVGLQSGKVYGVGKNSSTLFFPYHSSLSQGFPQALYTDRKGDIWMGINTKEGLYNLSEKKQYNLPFIKSIASYTDSALILSHSTKIWVLNKKNAPLEYFINPPGDYIKIFCSYYYNELLYIGTINGLYTYDGGKKNYLGATNSLLSRRITAMIKDQKGRLWVSTCGAGILILDNGKITQLDKSDGLSSNMCNYISKGLGNSMWVASNRGISRINYSTTPFTISTISAEEGLASNEVNQVVQIGDTVWAATNKGLSFFKPEIMIKNHRDIPIHWSRIAINSKDTSLLDNYTFSHEESSLQFDFIGISYHSGNKLTYRYQLQGLDTSWNYTTLTSLHYNYLQPGDYFLTINPQNLDGSWSQNTLQLSFSIDPPIWETWWFKLLLFTVLIGSAYTIIAVRNNNRRAFEKLSNDLNKTKHQALSAQMEPHFIFNTLNSIHNYILSEDKRFASKYLARFSSLMRKMLDHSQKNYISLDEELSALKLYMELEKLRFKNKFNFRINLTINAAKKPLMVPTMILQPFIENAILHGLIPSPKEGLLELDFHLEKDDLICFISDNGIGIDASIAQKIEDNSDHNSVGMSITEKRLDLINVLYKSHMKLRIYQIDKEKGGTRVEICFPQDISFD